MPLQILRPAILSCVAFLVLVLVADVVFSLYSRNRPDAMLMLTSWQAYLGSAVLWIVAFTIGIRIESWLIRAKIH